MLFEEISSLPHPYQGHLEDIIKYASINKVQEVEKMPRSKVKITVMKKVDPSVIFDGDVPNIPGTDNKYGICTAFEEGQEYIINEGDSQPAGFCSWAWRDVYKDLSVLRHGGNFDPWVEKGVAITCCTDGIRPVSFKLERID